MRRRDFLGKTALGLGAAWLGSKGLAGVATGESNRFAATDLVALDAAFGLSLAPHRPDRRHDHDDGDELQQHT